MTSLPKNSEKFGHPRYQTSYMYHSKGIDKSYPKLNLSHSTKTLCAFCQIFTLFTMPAHQIWSCHVAQNANFDFFIFPNSTFMGIYVMNIRKSRKVS